MAITNKVNNPGTQSHVGLHVRLFQINIGGEWVCVFDDLFCCHLIFDLIHKVFTKTHLPFIRFNSSFFSPRKLRTQIPWLPCCNQTESFPLTNEEDPSTCGKPLPSIRAAELKLYNRYFPRIHLTHCSALEKANSTENSDSFNCLYKPFLFKLRSSDL